MKPKLVICFQKIKCEPSSDLSENIWLAIISRNKRIASFKLWIASSALLASLIGFVPAFKILSADLAQSGFYEYFSLAFSDSGLMVSYWQEFTFSLAESLPIMSIILSLSLIFIFFFSLKYAINGIIKKRLSFTKFVTLSF